MNILILTIADENFTDVGAISFPNKQAYADCHGYRFIQETILLDRTRHPSWNKIPWVLHHLHSYDWIFWTDADSLIMNPEIRLEDIIEDSHKEFIVAKDENGINAGSFLIENDKWSFEFLAKVYAQKQFVNHQWWEQAAITLLLQEAQHRGHVHYVPQSTLNSYVTPYVQTYKEGDFIAHFVGMGREKWNLIGLMRKWAYGEPYECVWYPAGHEIYKQWYPKGITW